MCLPAARARLSTQERSPVTPAAAHPSTFPTGFWPPAYQAAANQLESGRRVSAKIVPAVIETSARQPAQAVQVAYAQRPTSASVQRTLAMFQPKLWLELASGENVDALAGKFRRLKASDPEVFQGITPYVARSADRTRLIVGPFRGESDVANFSEDLDTLGETSGLTPDYRWKVARTIKQYPEVLKDFREMKVSFQD